MAAEPDDQRRLALRVLLGPVEKGRPRQSLAHRLRRLLRRRARRGTTRTTTTSGRASDSPGRRRASRTTRSSAAALASSSGRARTTTCSRRLTMPAAASALERVEAPTLSYPIDPFLGARGNDGQRRARRRRAPRRSVRRTLQRVDSAGAAVAPDDAGRLHRQPGHHMLDRNNVNNYRSGHRQPAVAAVRPRRYQVEPFEHELQRAQFSLLPARDRRFAARSAVHVVARLRRGIARRRRIDAIQNADCRSLRVGQHQPGHPPLADGQRGVRAAVRHDRQATARPAAAHAGRLEFLRIVAGANRPAVDHLGQSQRPATCPMATIRLSVRSSSPSVAHIRGTSRPISGSTRRPLRSLPGARGGMSAATRSADRGCCRSISRCRSASRSTAPQHRLPLGSVQRIQSREPGEPEYEHHPPASFGRITGPAEPRYGTGTARQMQFMFGRISEPAVTSQLSALSRSHRLGAGGWTPSQRILSPRTRAGLTATLVVAATFAACGRSRQIDEDSTKAVPAARPLSSAVEIKPAYATARLPIRSR